MAMEHPRHRRIPALPAPVAGHIERALDRLGRRAVAVIAASALVEIVVHIWLGPLPAVLAVAAIVGWAALAPVGDGGPGPRAGGANEPGTSSGPLWQAVLDGLPDPVLMLDADSIIVAANPPARAILEAAPGRPLAIVTRSPDLMAAVERAATSGEAQSCVLRMPVPVDRHLSCHVTPLGGGAPGVPAMLVVARDQTEQDRLARMRADFVANASHELRTPLASLKGFVETLRGAARDDTGVRDRFLAIMQTDAERMSRLIEDLLSLSRVEMREHVRPEDVVDLVDVARGVVSSAAPAAARQAVTLSFTPDADEMPVVGDRDELVQVVQNLVQNAIKYGRKGGRVDVTLGSKAGRVALAVVDDGIGIAPENVPRLTERFYRVNAKESRERGGTGLGLAIVKHIVNRHKGELQIASRLGEGSTFKVLLPAASAKS